MLRFAVPPATIRAAAAYRIRSGVDNRRSPGGWAVREAELTTFDALGVKDNPQQALSLEA